jgi:hypothetical protein
MTPSQLARVLRAAAEECAAIVAEASAERAEWVDQSRSPLGPRRHCRAAQRLVAEGSKEAALVGRKQLLSPAAVTAELARCGKRTKPANESVAAELRRELRLVRGDR